jgi:hypothetical protein
MEKARGGDAGSAGRRSMGKSSGKAGVPAAAPAAGSALPGRWTPAAAPPQKTRGSSAAHEGSAWAHRVALVSCAARRTTSGRPRTRAVPPLHAMCNTFVQGSAAGGARMRAQGRATGPDAAHRACCTEGSIPRGCRLLSPPPPPATQAPQLQGRTRLTARCQCTGVESQYLVHTPDQVPGDVGARLSAQTRTHPPKPGAQPVPRGTCQSWLGGARKLVTQGFVPCTGPRRRGRPQERAGAANFGRLFRTPTP